MKTIPLTQGLCAMVDDVDCEYLSKFKWYALKNANAYYAVRNVYQPNDRQIKIHMHRVILECPDNFQVDHIDGNGLNNQKNNIRIVTSRQNHQNLHNIRSSKYPGVARNLNTTNPWSALIKINGKTKHLGVFPSETDAFCAYVTAVTNLGEAILPGVVS